MLCWCTLRLCRPPPPCSQLPFFIARRSFWFVALAHLWATVMAEGTEGDAVVSTPPFPENGPGLRPKFDGVELLLLDHATPPEVLLENIDKLGTEIGAGVKQTSCSAAEESAIPWPETTPDIDALLSVESITTWDFELIKLNELTRGRPLALLAYALIESYDLMNRLKLDRDKLKRYLLALEAKYNTCLYHNPMHAADVMHAFCYLLRDLAAGMPAEELLIAILAGPAHDLGHPGVNNALLIKRKHALSEKFPTSVLENHHAALAVELIQQPDKDVLSFLNDATEGAQKKEKLRQLLSDLVLYTDMSLHGKIVQRLNEMHERKETLDITVEENRLIILQALLHAADLSNPCKKW